MKLFAPFVQLPLTFDSEMIAREIKALGESCWMPHPQGFPGNSMLPLIAVDGDSRNESFSGVMKPTPFLESCHYMRQVLSALGVTLGRTRLMRLSGHAEVTKHADQGYYWADRMRVHLPVVTQPTVRFECGDAHVNMAAGEVWIFDTWRQHRVLNDSGEERIHLVADTVGGDEFWFMVGNGRDHNKKPIGAGWQPAQIKPDLSVQPKLTLESTNIPIVMTPWELSSRLNFILSEAVPHPNMMALKQESVRFSRYWLSLWAAYGERKDGWGAYRGAVEVFLNVVDRLGSEIILQNQLALPSVVRTLIAKVAVTGNDVVSIPEGQTATLAEPRKVPARVADDVQFERPIFIVSSPRSGSTMLFEAMARSPELFTIGGESHALIENVEALSPARNGLGSNRLLANSATPSVTATLRDRFLSALRDCQGVKPSGRVRMLEKTPKNSLRVPFLSEVFPEATFLYLHRDPREVLSSMIEAWQSGRFKTYPSLPGWQGLPWSLLLVPGWEKLKGMELPEIVAYQWQTATEFLLDDLEAVPRERVFVTTYDRLIKDSADELSRLAREMRFAWRDDLASELPFSRYTVTAPAAEKWRRNESAILPLMEKLQNTVARAERFVSGRLN